MTYVVAHSNCRIADIISGAAAGRVAASGKDISVKMLRDFFPAAKHDPLNKPRITELAGLEVIGDPKAVIWVPDPTDRDWFEMLREQGHQGHRVLLNIGFSNAYDLFRHATHYVEIYQQRPDTGQYDTSRAVDRLYEILKN